MIEHDYLSKWTSQILWPLGRANEQRPKAIALNSNGSSGVKTTKINYKYVWNWHRINKKSSVISQQFENNDSAFENSKKPQSKSFFWRRICLKATAKEHRQEEHQPLKPWVSRAKEMAPRLRALATLPEASGLIHSTHTVVKSQPQRLFRKIQCPPLFLSGMMCSNVEHTCIQAKHSYT